MADYTSIPLLALISEQNLLEEFQLEETAEEMEKNGTPIHQVLQDLGFIDADTITQILSDHLEAEVVDLNDALITPELLQIIPSETAQQHQCLPVAHFDPTLQVALVDPLNPSIIDEIGFVSGKDVQVVVAAIIITAAAMAETGAAK